jgi:hypothetical protein
MVIDNRDEHEKTVMACEGDSCKPRFRCMQADCIAPVPCQLQGRCIAREIYANGKKEMASQIGK